MPIIPRSYYAAAQQGREDAQAEQINRLRTQAMQGDLNQENMLRGLMQNPDTTPEQFARVGRSDIANAITNEQARAAADKASQAKEFATQMVNAAKYAQQVPAGQTKPFIEKNFPMLAQTYGPDWANASDDQIRQELTGIAAKFGTQAGIAPQEEKFSSPQNAVYQGKPSLIQVGDKGTVRPVNGASPYNKPDASSSGANFLTPEGQDLAAQEYLASGKLPPGLGKAAAGVNAKIVSRAAELAAANGDDAKAATIRRASFVAAKKGMDALTKQRTMVGAFERTALKNLEIALDESSKVDRTGSPAINRWLLAGKKNIGGDVEVGRFNAALTSALNEYAKVLSGATGSAGISDAARKEAEDLLSTANTPEQVAGIIDIMKREMANREAGFAEQEAQLQETMGGKPNINVAPAATGAPKAPGAQVQTKAPPQAEAYLKQHPELATQFKAKYGYLPQ